MFLSAMGWHGSAHVSFTVLLVLDGTFVYLFNVVLVARLDFCFGSPRCRADELDFDWVCDRQTLIGLDFDWVCDRQT